MSASADPRTHVHALPYALVLNDVVILVVRARDPRVIDRVDVTKTRVLLQTDCTAHDARQTVQADLLEVGHLEDDQGVVVEEMLAADDGQVREDVAEGLQAVDAVKKHVAGDLAQPGERQVLVVGHLQSNSK